MKKGVLITFEGIEGSGKSTHLRILGEFLRAKGMKVLLTFEPGGTPLGRALRDLLLDPSLPLDPLTELFLFWADRREHTLRVLLPALDQGKVVLCDRYIDSTTAYQGYGRGVDLDFVLQGNRKATGGLSPHLTILLDCPPEVGLRRVKGGDRFEDAGLDFHTKVREGYLRIAEAEPERVKVVESASRDKGEVQEEVRRVVRTFLEAWAFGG
ncbi:MAG: dTMP kinase [Deltaproteobacteria bacterium]|nr:MAG: dTMP kinase [Deltaproteobacteria bacterium]